MENDGVESLETAKVPRGTLGSLKVPRGTLTKCHALTWGVYTTKFYSQLTYLNIMKISLGSV